MQKVAFSVRNTNGKDTAYIIHRTLSSVSCICLGHNKIWLTLEQEGPEQEGTEQELREYKWNETKQLPDPGIIIIC